MGSEAIILPAGFFTVGWIVYVIVDGFRRRQRLKVFTEFHGRLLDKLGSAQEFGAFFGSEAGERFLDSLSTERGAPHDRILRALQWGLTSLVLGISIFILVASSHSWDDPDDTQVLLFLATVTVGIGGGMLISSVLSFLLSRRLGLISDRRDGGMSS